MVTTKLEKAKPLLIDSKMNCLTTTTIENGKFFHRKVMLLETKKRSSPKVESAHPILLWIETKITTFGEMSKELEDFQINGNSLIYMEQGKRMITFLWR